MEKQPEENHGLENSQLYIDDNGPIVDNHSVEAAYGESLQSMLNLQSWQAGGDLSGIYQRIEDEVSDAVSKEDAWKKAIRQKYFPLIGNTTRPGAPTSAGLYRAKIKQLATVHSSVLLNGGVEVCDGTSVEHDTLPITITSIGVVLASYHGQQQSYAHQTFRRDLRADGGDPFKEVEALLDNRSQRGSTGNDERSRLSELARRGIMTFAERAVLTEKATAPWRMGHGNPVPYELLTGSGSMELLSASLTILQRLINEHRKFLFIPSEPTDRALLTLGQALHPLEYLVIQTAEQKMLDIVDKGHYSQKFHKKAKDFCLEVGPQIVVGVYRAAQAAPAYMFYCHADFVHEAALIALADSILQEHRGFPMLIDLADMLCQTTFGAEAFNSIVQTAYASAGAPFRYLTERQTRR